MTPKPREQYPRIEIEESQIGVPLGLYLRLAADEERLELPPCTEIDEALRPTDPARTTITFLSFHVDRVVRDH